MCSLEDRLHHPTGYSRQAGKQEKNHAMKIFRLIAALVFLSCAVNGFAEDAKADDLYKSKCQGCHGAEGKATNIGKKLGAKDFQDPEVMKMSQDERVKIISDGKNKMFAYKSKLTNEEIKALAKYIAQLK
jgi:mono/diheme cytochrome c family protein